MKIRSILLWLVFMPTIIFIDIICFIFGIFSRDVRQLYIRKFYGNSDKYRDLFQEELEDE